MRSSGVLLHITSLPSTLGVGTLGQAGKFIRFLKKSRQSFWQILPVTPTDADNSPYSSPSAFAGNTLLIDPAELVREGLLSLTTLKNCSKKRGNDFDYAKANKNAMLREAFCNFKNADASADFAQFQRENQFWLSDYALFCALKKRFGGKSWADWDDEGARSRDPEALAAYSQKLSDEINFNIFCQYIFFKQWKNFRKKLRRAKIKLIGDIPIYVAYDSADVWAHPELFKLNSDRRPLCVAGVPPDYFSADGQLWGNPIYDWQAMKADGFDWWTRRVSKCAELFDVLRIDHFRAFDSFYEIPFGQTTAREGRWQKGVGYEFLRHLQNSVPQLTIVAEDLGDIPQSVLDLRDKCGLAGMKVVQFAFDGNPKNPFLPQNFEKHCVAYLGTHDNDTTLGWWNNLDETSRKRALETSGLNVSATCESYFEIGDDKTVDGQRDNCVNNAAQADRSCENKTECAHVSLKFIELLAQSRAELVVFCLQDLAEADSTCRMNTPGTLGCWKYMAKSADFSDERAKWLAKVTTNTERC